MGLVILWRELSYFSCEIISLYTRPNELHLGITYSILSLHCLTERDRVAPVSALATRRHSSTFGRQLTVRRQGWEAAAVRLSVRRSDISLAVLDSGKNMQIPSSCAIRIFLRFALAIITTSRIQPRYKL